MKKAFWNAHMFMVECGEALPDHLGLYRYGFRVSSGVHAHGEGEMVSIRYIDLMMLDEPGYNT